MSENAEDLPDYMKSYQATDNQLWEQIEKRFDELRELVETTRLETRKEAVGEAVEKGKWRDTAPRWEDPEIGVNVRPWLLVPYIKAVDQDYLQDCYETAGQLIPRIEKALERKALTIQFLGDWGAFCRYAGAIEVVYFGRQDEMESVRREISNRPVIEERKRRYRWCAHYIWRALQSGKKHYQLFPIGAFFISTRCAISIQYWRPVVIIASLKS